MGACGVPAGRRHADSSAGSSTLGRHRRVGRTTARPQSSGCVRAVRIRAPAADLLPGPL
jgi:hypothetical protein